MPSLSISLSLSHTSAHTHGWDRSVENYTSPDQYFLNKYLQFHPAYNLPSPPYIYSKQPLCLSRYILQCQKAYHFNIKILLKGYY